MVVSFTQVVYGLGEIEISTVATSVIDGYSFETTSEGTIRLADGDIQCNDWDNSTGFMSSKSIFSSLIEGKMVYLDIDNLYITGYLGTGNRTVAVTYINHNSTHFFNIYYALVKTGFAIIEDAENDFNPEDWSNYLNKENIHLASNFPPGIILLLSVIATLVIIILRKLSNGILI